MKKAELEALYHSYHSHVSHANLLIEHGEIVEALKTAFRALDYADGMMQYGRKYLKEDYKTLRAVDIVLLCAPLVFDSDVLDDISKLLKDTRRLERNTSDSLEDLVKDAQETLQISHQLWNYIEQHDNISEVEIKKALGLDQRKQTKIISTWYTMGLLERRDKAGQVTWGLYTRMDAPSKGKCPSCGYLTTSSKSQLLNQIQCPKCGKTDYFVLIFH